MSYERDRRRDPRVQVKVRMEMIDGDTGRSHVLHTTNLSCGGARCTVLGHLPTGVELSGHLYLPLSEAGRDVDVAIPVKARVVRVERCTTGTGGELSLAFDAMSDVDRAELASYLFAWLADDCFTCAHSEVGALS